MFIENLKNTLNNEVNVSVTENGAIGFRTSGKNLLDINFAVFSLRSKNPSEITNMFMKAFYDDKLMAMKWLFYTRDIRGGLGERRLFRIIFEYLSKNNPEIVKNLVDLIPEFGRFDDMWILLETEFKSDIINMVSKQLKEDLDNVKNNQPISLLAKWLPSVNTSSKDTIKKAKIIIKELKLTDKVYRKTLSKLRKYLDVVEIKMSSKEWSAIKYEAVPSRANLIYNGAFLRNDEERRRNFLSSLEKGETKINAGTLFPHDIVHKYNIGRKPSQKNIGLEEMWKALPNTVNGCENTIVVADGSGSMGSTVSGTNVSALSVANALAIYFAERSSGQFKDKYITFSTRPQLVDFSKVNSLKEKLEIALRHSEVADTNIEAVFDLILATAIKGKMTQEELPNNILIVSDMEFNSCATSNGGGGRSIPDRLFDVINNKYITNGYKMPRMIFWNVNSRTGTIPIKDNKLGVALISGFSPNVMRMVMSSKLDAYECLLETLNSERYDIIGERLKSIN